MEEITNEELIEKAKSVIKPVKISGGFTVGDVGCALVTDRNNIYTGVCIDLACGIGFCAEHSAIAAMVTGGEYRIKKIVALYADGTILPPCGRCREFIWQINEENRDTEVIIEKDKVIKMTDLLPHHWQSKF